MEQGCAHSSALGQRILNGVSAAMGAVPALHPGPALGPLAMPVPSLTHVVIDLFLFPPRLSGSVPRAFAIDFEPFKLALPLS